MESATSTKPKSLPMRADIQQGKRDAIHVKFLFTGRDCFAHAANTD
ncbi:hypothetical protein [Nitrosopumilus maritimus]|nr:hypothetical protein [Nitrosopumilus maritimus]